MTKFLSPGLTAVFDDIKISKKSYVLDLGEMRSTTFTTISQLGCKIHFENLRELVIRHQEETDVSFKDLLDEYIMDHAVDTQFDLILFWDLINFLSIENTVYLFKKLEPYCKPNSLVHSFTYMGKTLPKTPSRFTLTDTKSVDIELFEKVENKRTPITTLTIVKNLKKFMMETSMFNSNNLTSGLSENILRYVPQLENRHKSILKKKYTHKHNQISTSRPAFREVKNRVRHYSPGLNNILYKVKGINDSKIVDLGGDLKSNSHLLLNYSKSLFPENLRSLIKVNNNKTAYLKMNRQTLVFEKDIKFDVILTWDVFNYLSFDDLKTINERLEACSKPGTLIYILGYSGSQRPNSPQHFFLNEDGYTDIESYEELVKNGEKLSVVNLLKAFTNTRVVNNYLLHEGMARGYCEYILEYK